MAGLLVGPVSLVLMASSLSVGRLGGRLGARTLSTAGMLCVSASLLGLSLLDAGASFLCRDRLTAGRLGVGGGLFHPPNSSATLNTVPSEHLSVANGFLSTARNFGQAIGAALAATFLAEGLGPAGSMEAFVGPVGTRLGGHHLEAFLAARASRSMTYWSSCPFG